MSGVRIEPQSSEPGRAGLAERHQNLELVAPGLQRTVREQGTEAPPPLWQFKRATCRVHHTVKGNRHPEYRHSLRASVELDAANNVVRGVACFRVDCCVALTLK